jgi:hypothetical protein
VCFVDKLPKRDGLKWGEREREKDRGRERERGRESARDPFSNKLALFLEQTWG